MDAIMYVVIGLIATVGAWVIWGSRRKTWYKIHLADNSVMLAYRGFRERLWRTSDRYIRFRKEDGREITFPSGAHWILDWEEIPIAQLEVAKVEVQNEMRKAAESGN